MISIFYYYNYYYFFLIMFQKVALALTLKYFIHAVKCDVTLSLVGKLPALRPSSQGHLLCNLTRNSSTRLVDSCAGCRSLSA